MNERIFDMARQSGATDEKGSRAEHVFCFTKDELKGFAELIVKECVNTLEFHGFDEAIPYIKWMATNKLGHRFGVKE